MSNSVSKRDQRIGIFWLVGPIALLVFTLFAFGIVTFWVNGTAGTDQEVFFRLIRVILGLLGMIAVLGLIVGIPVGISYLSKKDAEDGTPYDERSGKGESSTIPAEISGWNWGAAGLSWIWGIYHRVWISLLAFIPFVNLVFWIVMGIKGNEWAWRKTRWESVEAFKRSQKKWGAWGLGLFILNVLLTLWGVVSGLDQ